MGGDDGRAVFRGVYVPCDQPGAARLSCFFRLRRRRRAAYIAILMRFWNEPVVPPRIVIAAILLALAFRAPLVAPRVNFDSDMVRYLWDGRVQVHGFNPYHSVPSDPGMAALHTDETRRMPSVRARTPYPPGAQLFFRLVVSIHDSTRTMKLALVACDLLTILILWRWLPLIGRPEWLVVAYAWNPLVILEIAHSGHIDALGALWVVASAYWLTRGRPALASIGLVMAIATKLLPIVLLPLFWRRVRVRDACAAAAFLGVLYLLYTKNGMLAVRRGSKRHRIHSFQRSLVQSGRAHGDAARGGAVRRDYPECRRGVVPMETWL